VNSSPFSAARRQWRLAARAQQPERMRRIGMLMQIAADDPQAKPRLATFRQGLQDLGWQYTGRHPLDRREPRRRAQISGAVS
jgi:hypothetical protein